MVLLLPYREVGHMSARFRFFRMYGLRSSVSHYPYNIDREAGTPCDFIEQNLMFRELPGSRRRLHKERPRIVCSKRERIAPRIRPDIRLAPHIMHHIALRTREARHRRERDRLALRCRGSVEHKDVRPGNALSGVELGRSSGAVERHGGYAVCRVLVESDELGVLYDGELVGG